MTLPLVKITDASLFIPGQLPRVPVLKNINLAIHFGTHLALSGANGSGKSSLLRLIHGDLWPCAGEIIWYGNGYCERSPIAGRELCALVSPSLQESWQARQWQLDVGDFLKWGMESRSSPKERPERLLAELGAEDLVALTLPALSQGQLKLVLLAQALLREPALLLLDEWADGLDKRHRELVQAALMKRAKTITMLFAAPRPDHIPEWVTDYIYLEGGRLHQGKSAEPVQGSSRPAGARGKTECGKPLLFELDNVSVVRDGRPILKNIVWRMGATENWLFLGPNGAGKSTFLRLLAGEEFAYAGGKLRHWSPRLGRTVTSLGEKRQCVHLVSDLGQACYGYPLSGLELVLSGLDNTAGIYREFDGHQTAWAESLLELFFGGEWQKIADQSIRRLSSGQLRLLHLCRSLAGQPDVLLLDEPCSGLDEPTQRHFFEVLEELTTVGRRGWKPAIILVSHQLRETPSFVTHRASLAGGELCVEADGIK